MFGMLYPYLQEDNFGIGSKLAIALPVVILGTYHQIRIHDFITVVTNIGKTGTITTLKVIILRIQLTISTSYNISKIKTIERFKNSLV